VFIFTTTLTSPLPLSFLRSPPCPGGPFFIFRLFRPWTNTSFSSRILFLFSPRLGGNFAIREPQWFPYFSWECITVRTVLHKTCYRNWCIQKSSSAILEALIVFTL
jgi:hypothetical protein